MSHESQLKFFQAVASANPELVKDARILEVGSFDVNGTMRFLFQGASAYTGVDLTPGPGVDWVGPGHEVGLPTASFDLTLSAECFEHDPHWQLTFANMIRLTRPGGLVVISCAGMGRLEHGTSRTNSSDSPGTQSVGMDHYRNLSRRDFERAVNLGTVFDNWAIMSSGLDLYFVGVRGPQTVPPSGTLPSAAAFRLLHPQATLRRRALTSAMRVMNAILPAATYQSVALSLVSARSSARGRLS